AVRGRRAAAVTAPGRSCIVRSRWVRHTGRAGGASKNQRGRSLLPAGASLGLCQHMVDVSEPVSVRTARSETRSVPTVPWRVFGARGAQNIFVFDGGEITGRFCA